MAVINGTTGINTIQDNTVTSAKIVDGSITNTDLQTPYRMVQMTPADMTNGGANNLTFKDFTGIPSWAKRITVMFAGVSTSGTSIVQVQLGSNTLQTSGYMWATTDTISGSSTVAQSSGFMTSTTTDANAALLRHGEISFTNLNSNIWSCRGNLSDSNIPITFAISGSVTLSETLYRIRITTVTGTDTFDAGTINITYEG